MCPGSSASVASSKMSATCPILRTARTRAPSDAAMPALSCPRCCSAYRPEVGELRRLRVAEDPEHAAGFVKLVEHQQLRTGRGPSQAPGAGGRSLPVLTGLPSGHAPLDGRLPRRFRRLDRRIHRHLPTHREPDAISARRSDRRHRNSRGAGRRQHGVDPFAARPKRRCGRPTRRTASPRADTARAAVAAVHVDGHAEASRIERCTRPP